MDSLEESEVAFTRGALSFDSVLTFLRLYSASCKIGNNEPRSGEKISDFNRGPNILLWVAALLTGLGSLAGLTGCGKSTTAIDTSSNAPTGAVRTPVSSAAEPNQSAAMPASLASLGEYGENIYDAAKSKRWTEAAAKSSALKTAIQQSSAELGKAEDKRTQLQAIITSLDSAIGKREQATAMRAANQVTLVGSELAASYHPKVPADVARLDYDGRELEIWSRLNDRSKLKSTAQDMRQTWTGSNPK